MLQFAQCNSIASYIPFWSRLCDKFLSNPFSPSELQKYYNCNCYQSLGMTSKKKTELFWKERNLRKNNCGISYVFKRGHIFGNILGFFVCECFPTVGCRYNVFIPSSFRYGRPLRPQLASAHTGPCCILCLPAGWSQSLCCLAPGPLSRTQHPDGDGHTPT